jgi:2-oxoglutarate dehydrogenase E2 component (dihydrolipoamide succinyltransferase)
MTLIDLVMPKLGESITEATILKWHKKAGDLVKQDETVLEIATDKVDSEVPSTVEGIFEETLFKENDVVPIGTVIARIRTDNEEKRPVYTQNHSPAASTEIHKTEEEKFIPHTPASGNGHLQTEATNRFYSPLVLTIASSEGLNLNELEKIEGTGNEGRVTKRDILKYVSDKKSGPDQVLTRKSEEMQIVPSVEKNQPIQREEAPSPAIYSGNVEIIEMDRMRKLIADHMVRSKQTSPHVTSFAEADVSNLVQWREKVKNEFEKREGIKITFTPLFIEAVIRCIKKYPLINSSVDGGRIIIKKDINIGMATALPSGSLIVPVIRNADQLNLVGLAKQVNSLAENARNNRLRPDDTQGGTFTLTNVGTFGSLMGTPIINQPQVAILAIGAIKKRPVVLETAQGDSIAIRHMMYLSMSYDHRIIDGSLGATFLTAVANELQNFNPERDF